MIVYTGAQKEEVGEEAGCGEGSRIRKEVMAAKGRRRRSGSDVEDGRTKLEQSSR